MPSFPEALPAARTPPSEAAPALRWGVLGTGWIADRFIRSLQRHTRQQLLAVGSRDADRAAAFAGRHGLPRSCGSYPVSLATWVLGAPARVLAAGQPHQAGVNGQAAVILCDPGGNQAVLHTTLFSGTPTTATIAGTHATLTLPGPFYQPGDLLLTSADGESRLAYTEPRTAHDDLHFEAAEAARRIAEGRLESPIRPLAEAVATLQVMDEIRSQIGVAFPGEH